MKKVLLVIFSCFSLYINSLAQTCEECKQRSIIIYDNEVSIPEPDYASLPVNEQIKAYREWTNLYYIAGGVKNYANQDATAECLVRLCSAFFTETDSVNTTIRTGIGHPNLPPSGSTASGDYIIYGSVTGSGGNYSLQLKLETAKSRELVKSATVNFQAGFDPLDIGFKAASNFGALYNTCLDFEKKKRDEGEPFAISPKIEAVPEKSSLQKNESTNIEFTLKDCDGQPLKNRTVQLLAENGTFDTQNLTTDESGKCKAKFTAGENAGAATINSTTYYRKPTETSTNFTSEGGTAYLEIEREPYWKFKCDYSFEENVTFEQNLENTSTVNTESYKRNTGSIYALVDEKSWGNGVYSTNSTVSEDIYGDYLETFNERDLVNASDDTGSLYSNTVKTNECYGPADKDNLHVNISISSNNRHFAFTNNVSTVKGGGVSNKIYIYCQDGQCIQNPSSEILDCDGSSTYGGGTHSYDVRKGNSDTSYVTVENPGLGMTITHNVYQTLREDGNKFTFQYNDDATEETVQGTSKRIAIIKESVNIVINPETTTDVKNDRVFIPENYLYQNSPNPFNPQTIIRYSLSKPGNVKLFVYDLLGRELKVLVNSFQAAGNHFVSFDASGLNSGVYFYRIDVNGFTSSKKMLLLK